MYKITSIPKALPAYSHGSNDWFPSVPHHVMGVLVAMREPQEERSQHNE